MRYSSLIMNKNNCTSSRGTFISGRSNSNTTNIFKIIVPRNRSSKRSKMALATFRLSHFIFNATLLPCFCLNIFYSIAAVRLCIIPELRSATICFIFIMKDKNHKQNGWIPAFHLLNRMPSKR